MKRPRLWAYLLYSSILYIYSMHFHEETQDFCLPSLLNDFIHLVSVFCILCVVSLLIKHENPIFCHSRSLQFCVSLATCMYLCDFSCLAEGEWIPCEFLPSKFLFCMIVLPCVQRNPMRNSAIYLSVLFVRILTHRIEIIIMWPMQ